MVVLGSYANGLKVQVESHSVEHQLLTTAKALPATRPRWAVFVGAVVTLAFLWEALTA